MYTHIYNKQSNHECIYIYIYIYAFISNHECIYIYMHSWLDCLLWFCIRATSKVISELIPIMFLRLADEMLSDYKRSVPRPISQWGKSEATYQAQHQR